jgi:glycosyltransferase involved in cell wall biosynthesis
MRILHLESGRQLFGGARQVLQLQAGLAPLGVAGTLVCPAGSAVGLAAAAQGLEVVTIPLGGDLDFGSVSRLRQVLRRLQPDLLHVHSRRGADFFGALAAAATGTPALLTRRVDDPAVPLLGAAMYRRYHGVVGISRAVVAQLAAAGVPPHRVTRIPSAVDVAHWHPTWSDARFRQEFGLPAAGPVCAAVTQFIPRKDPRLLLAAWNLVRQQWPDARLLLFGSGGQEARLRRLAGPGVVFAGFRPDLPHFLGHVDLLLHAARREGLGLALLEAQAAGVPVVAAAVGGVVEAVEHGRTGLLVPVGDAAALAAAVLALLGDPARRRALGAAGRERVVREFSPAAMAGAYRSLYQDTLATVTTPA